MIHVGPLCLGSMAPINTIHHDLSYTSTHFLTSMDRWLSGRKRSKSAPDVLRGNNGLHSKRHASWPVNTCDHYPTAAGIV